MNITYSATKITFKTWHTDMPNFYFSPDGISLVPRAGFQISEFCPKEYKLIIAECINNGWLKPVSHQPVQEVFLEELTK